MKSALRPHMLVAASTPACEVARKNVLASVVVGIGPHSGTYVLNKLLTSIGSLIRGSMKETKRYGSTSKTLYENKEFCQTVLVQYLIASGFTLQQQRGLSGFTFSCQDRAIVEKAIGGHSNFPNRQDPFVNFNPISGVQLLNIHKQVLGYVDLPVVRNPKTARKEELLVSLQIEMGVLPSGMGNLSCDELEHRLVEHRLEHQTYFGMAWIHSLEVSPANPFVLTVNPGRLGQAAIKVRYRLHKDRVVFTLNQPTVLQRFY